MVSLVETWEDIEEYAKWCRYGSYQTRESVDGFEVRVVVGKFGYVRCFEDAEDQALKRILGFCKAEGFIKVLGNVPDDVFFTMHKED